MDGGSKHNQPLIPPSEADIESALASLMDKMAETNGIRLPNLLYLADDGKFFTTEEADLRKSALEIALRALVHSSASMVKKLAMKLNASAPVTQLPPEILSQVLLWSLEPDKQYVRTLHGLALVGWQWFSHVRAATELWTTLRTDQRIDEIRLLLRKSKKRLLRVIVAGSISLDALNAAEAEKNAVGELRVLWATYFHITENYALSLGTEKLALPGTSSDIPRSWTDQLIHLPSLISLKLRYLSPHHLLLLAYIDAPNCATVVFGDENVVLEEAVAQEMPPLLRTALTTIFRSCNLIAIQATRRRGLCILLHRPSVQSPVQLDFQTSRPVEMLNVVGGVLTSRRIRTPVTLYFEEQVPLTEKTMGKFPTLRQIDVVGGSMCEDLMRCLAHTEVSVDGKRKVLCPNLEYVRMTYVWGESVPSSHCTLLPDAARRRWIAENIDDPWDRPFWPEEFAIFPPGEVSTEFREAVKEAQRMVPAIRLVENEEWFFMKPADWDWDWDTDM
ncbi:hypothetical protein FS837_005466 [Tulasnella sp. UAMH 9824]|nr:hypothetical protein FS837_005466 [Tulasnella sp. UAMH 9824]